MFGSLRKKKQLMTDNCTIHQFLTNIINILASIFFVCAFMLHLNSAQLIAKKQLSDDDDTDNDDTQDEET